MIATTPGLFFHERMRGQSAGEQRASSVVSSLALDRYLKARERLEE